MKPAAMKPCWSRALWTAALSVASMVSLTSRDAAGGATDSDQAANAGSCRCTPAASAVNSVVAAVAGQLGKMPAAALVVSAPLSTDTPAPRAQQLAIELAKQLAGRLGAESKAHQRTLTLAAARRAARRAAALVFVRPQIQTGRLLLRADAYPVPRTVWARARNPHPGPTAHGFATARLDAEVRSYLQAIPFDAPKVRKFKTSQTGTVALACGDLDGDGALDLAVVHRSRISTVRLRDGAAHELRATGWPDLAPVAPVPLRQPLGFATIVNRQLWSSEAHLDVGLTDRAFSVRLDERLQLIDKLAGIAVPLDGASACTTVRGMFLDVSLGRCHPHDGPLPEASLTSLTDKTDALTAARLVGKSGRVSSWLAYRNRQGALWLFDGQRQRPPGLRVGAQIALADLDQDGQPELAASRDVLTAAKDALEVFTVPAAGPVKRRYRLAVPKGIEALTACPPDGPGRSALVLATAKELWVVR